MKRAIWTWIASEPVAPIAIWKQRLGPDYDTFKRAFLRPLKGLSKTFLCDQVDHPSCGSYLIRKRSDGFVGICEAGECPVKHFTEDDLWRFELQPKAALSELARCLRLNISVSLSDAEHGIWHIGRYRPNTHSDFPVFVVLCPSDRDASSGIRNLLSHHSGPCLIGVLPDAEIPLEIRVRVEQARSQIFIVEEIAHFEGGKLAASPLWSDLLTRFQAAAVPAEDFATVKFKKYATPANACWADLRILMQTGDDALVKVDGEKSPGWVPYNFREMGLAQKSGRKTLAWKFFVENLAENYGGPVCPKPAERDTFVSRKREIARALIDVFGIPGDPLPFNETPPEIGYKTAFLIFPEGSE